MAVDEIGRFRIAAAGLLEEVKADALSYLDFPASHKNRLRIDNVQE